MLTNNYKEIHINDIIKYTRSLTILYVEDDLEVLEYIGEILDNFFLKVIKAVNGVDGLEKFVQYENQIDIIISDINMPKMSGIDMIQKIKNRYPNFPIILLSAYNSPEYFMEAMDVNADAYILKPINMTQFLKALTKVVNKVLLVKDNLDYQKNLVQKVEDQEEQLLQKEKELALFKDDIITIFTHELKTPLNTIVAYSDYIRNTISKNNLTNKKIDKIAELTNKIYHNGMIQAHMIENLLEIGRIKSGSIEIEKQNIRMGYVIGNILTSYTNAYDKELIKDINNSIEAILDKRIFTMIFTNLYSNALKYSKNKVKVSLCNNKDKEFILTIEDDGIGIPKHKRDEIFNIFEQLDTTVLKREKKGTGVGLFTVKHFANICNIDIILDDSLELGGARFIISREKI